MSFSLKIRNPYGEHTVKELLEDYFLIPRKIRHFLRVKKHVLINNEFINWQTVVQENDTITLIFDDEDYPTKKIPLGRAELIDCLYEDEHLIIVNKLEGMKTHGNQPNEIALLNHVSAYSGQTCYVVHRLDMETSGAVLFAKNPFILPLINQRLERKEIWREYWALVEGKFSPKHQVLRDKIGRNRHDRRKRIIDSKNGQHAMTIIDVLKYTQNSSLIKCRLETGRTHQIRIHLSHHGHPLIGDPLYNPSSNNERLMLHAHRLTLSHPLTCETISVEAPSSTFEKILNNYKKGVG
ncbi:TPA: RluA family pseudouridine synthase [Streptococcus agalactiae]